LGTFRNEVRQLIADQLAGHLAGVTTVVDVGCGQGTQAVQLAARGLQITGVDPSEDLLKQLHATAAERGVSVRATLGEIDDLDSVLPETYFDLVCAHGLLMYLPDAYLALQKLMGPLKVGGRISFTVRNGDALAYRPGLRGDWKAALEAFHSTSYVNELGAQANAHRLDEVLGWCADLGLQVLAWYGVRVFTDPSPASERPDPESFEDCLAVERLAGRTDPYRRLASQLHVVAQRAR
jgi:2-polyprenyl-3-methyl-5-hydroxy-6-metoxy-1,4-benzoquinol methylase